MAYSMTGFGRSQGKFGSTQVNIEIRTVNHRFQEISLRLPKLYSQYENSLRDSVKKGIARGKISVFINVDYGDSKLEQLSLNTALANGYFKLLNDLKETTGLQEDITLAHLMKFDDIFKSDSNDEDDPELKTFLIKLVNEAITHLNAMRKDEGDAMLKDLEQRNAFISESVQFFKTESDGVAREEFEKLYQRIKDNIQSGDVDRERLEQEIALISDRVDISEEITRLESHVHLLSEELKKDESIGKRVNFIVQEMHREVNTIGSKSTKISILHKVVTVKEEIEKMREQIQNVE